jgi:hypothetical protein
LVPPVVRSAQNKKTDVWGWFFVLKKMVKLINLNQTMKTNQKGFAASTALLGAGAYIYISQTSGPKPAPIADQEVAQSEPVGKINPETDENISGSDKPLENKTLSGADGTVGWQAYRNEKCGYEIKYPAGYNPKEYNGDVSFVTSDTVKCHEQGGATETMCDEMNAGPYIGCGLATDFLNGAASLQAYIAQGMEDYSISPKFLPKPVNVGSLSGTEVEGSGAAGAYKDIYLEKGNYVIQFSVSKEGNAAGIKIYDQMLSTFNPIDK